MLLLERNVFSLGKLFNYSMYFVRRSGGMWHMPVYSVHLYYYIMLLTKGAEWIEYLNRIHNK